MSTKKSNLSIERIVGFLRDEKIKVSVFGEFSSGKTTFLNAFINEQILTVAYEPTTAVPTRIRYGKLFNILVYKNNKQIEYYFQPGEEAAIWRRIISRRSASNILGFLEKQKTSIQSFMTKWTKEGEKANQVQEVVIELPLQLLINRIELIDTPGTNNEYTEHRKFTENIALDTDIAIMLLDGTHGGASKTEFEFMNQVNKHVHNSLIVINKMDLIDSIEEYDDVMNYLKNDSIPKHWEHAVNPKVFGLSSKLRLEETESDNGTHLNKAFNSFMSELERIIEKNRGSILLERLGNPEKEILREARKLSKSEEVTDIHTALDKYDDLRKILIAADLSTKSVENGIQRIEEEQRKRFSSIEKNKDLFINLKDQENKLNIYNYYKKLTSLKNDMNTLGFEHTESDDEITRIEGKLKKIETNRQKIESLLKKIDSYFSMLTNPIDNSIPSAKMCFSEIESIGISKHFDDDFKNKINDYKKQINEGIKDHIERLKNHFLTITNKIEMYQEYSIRYEGIKKLYDYHKVLNLEYAIIVDYQDYLKLHSSGVEIVYEQMSEEKNIFALENRLEKIKNKNDLDQWKKDFKKLSKNLVHIKNIKELSKNFNKKKEKIEEYDNHLNPILEKINNLLLEPLTSREELIDLNQKIKAQPELSLEIANNRRHFSNYLGYFDNYSKSTLMGILHIDEKVELISYLVVETKTMSINGILSSTENHLKNKSIFLKNNYLTNSEGLSYESYNISPNSTKNNLLEYQYENYIYLFLDGQYYCRKCGRAYDSRIGVSNGSRHCTQRNPYSEDFKNKLFESLIPHKGIQRVLEDTYSLNKTSVMKKYSSTNPYDFISRHFSSIDLLWEMSKRLYSSYYEKSQNIKVLESFYNIPFSKGFFNSSLLEHPNYNKWLYKKLHYLEKIETRTLHKEYGTHARKIITYLNSQIKFVNDLNDINKNIISNNNSKPILKHLKTLAVFYKASIRKKVLLGLIPAAVFSFFIIGSMLSKGIIQNDDYWDAQFHTYVEEKDLNMALRVNYEIDDYNMQLEHFLKLDVLYKQLIKEKMKKSAIFKNLKHTPDSRAEENKRNIFINEVRTYVKPKDAKRFSYSIKE